MSSLNWTWRDWWVWFQQLETPEQKKMAIEELNRDNWLKFRTPRVQAEIFLYAPDEILYNLEKFPIIHDSTFPILREKLKRRE